MKTRTIVILLALWLVLPSVKAQLPADNPYAAAHRPQLHFSPKANWMNDPNGLVYNKGQYHLFFQYYPDSTVWGPMHWGHATSKNLVHWKQQAIALYPDSLGYIFSGSAVVDSNNTSGFGKAGKTPLVAIFTYHNPLLEKEKKDAQSQGLAYSLDEGNTWTKYAQNPVLANPGISDFRDPKISWFAPKKKWIMTLATKDRISFYASPDLKSWKKQSEFGEKLGGHGGVWECPDLISFDVAGKKVWVLLVSINPGGPNGGSATQYFIGDFNGSSFTPMDTATKWIDYGTDNYAGVTWSNTGKRKIFLGWMSNWQYANIVPTTPWRSAMTVPRELSLKKINNQFYLCSMPVKELTAAKTNAVTLLNTAVKGSIDLTRKLKNISAQYQLKISANQLSDCAITLSNSLGQAVIVGYDKKENTFFIDRTNSGKVDFEKDFAKRFTGPRISLSKALNITLVVDVASVELFADDGLTVMTGIFFPGKSYDQITISSPQPYLIKRIDYTALQPIW